MSNLGNKEIMAANIKRYLESRGMTMKDLSAELGVPYTTVCAWCSADTYPRIDKIELMAKFFGVTKADLVEDPADQDPVQAMLQEMKDNPQLGVLLSSTKDLNEEDLKMVIEMVKRLKASYRE